MKEDTPRIQVIPVLLAVAQELAPDQQAKEAISATLAAMERENLSVEYHILYLTNIIVDGLCDEIWS